MWVERIEPVGGFGWMLLEHDYDELLTHSSAHVPYFIQSFRFKVV